ncbi:hypothetical protein JS533_003545 [Bifidobacterium amazonense]|uniref:Uncharacterized protein n=1 Tax=Bifidobacterium amazonense TaxID=2809027 RepID=A0ABS9VTT1_9BIFI|nr:hypothetical protein [Bifidobacterium amazonense]MCH9275351.1 hypothetical protein [Bifidobacterium amazonense]
MADEVRNNAFAVEAGPVGLLVLVMLFTLFGVLMLLLGLKKRRVERDPDACSAFGPGIVGWFCNRFASITGGVIVIVLGLIMMAGQAQRTAVDMAGGPETLYITNVYYKEYRSQSNRGSHSSTSFYFDYAVDGTRSRSEHTWISMSGGSANGMIRRLETYVTSNGRGATYRLDWWPGSGVLRGFEKVGDAEDNFRAYRATMDCDSPYYSAFAVCKADSATDSDEWVHGFVNALGRGEVSAAGVPDVRRP